MKVEKGIDKCPYCGSPEYYIKQSFKGICNWKIRFDGEEVDNGDIYDNTTYKMISEFAWCSQCKKRLFKLDDKNE